MHAWRLRVSTDATNHSSTMQGITKSYLAYKPLFYEADNRMQIVFEAEIQHDTMAAYIEARESPFVLKTSVLMVFLALQKKPAKAIFCMELRPETPENYE